MAVHQFAQFELNEDLRQLRLGGRDVPMQPRAFDLLTYLVNNRTRVVGKEELLEHLWPGVIVTDGSLQRAVSLARAILREGGLDDAIRTYTGRGYRFMPDLLPAAPVMATRDAAAGARELFGQGQWTRAVAAFEAVDREAGLGPRDLECWGAALQCSGATPAAREPFERAANAYSNLGDGESTARAVISLARVHFETREWAVCTGCLQRAATILESLPLCEQHGHLAWMRSWLASYRGDLDEMMERADETMDIGRRLGNLDIESMGLLFRGMALQAGGDARRGLELQDEAGAAVLTGNVSPLLGGLIYCGLLGGCCNTGDWPRAGEWCENFSSWCERNGMNRFSGSCLLHRVEVFIARGELDRAEDEIREGGGTLEISSASVVADAQRFLADVHLLRGNLGEAETAYRRAHELGADPHPGYALLLHRRGQSEAAVRALLRSADGVSWAARERKPLYLAHAASICARRGDVGAARQIVDELLRHPHAWDPGTTRAHVLVARAETAYRLDDFERAAGWFRDAIRVYRDRDAQVEAASTRLRLAELLIAGEDPDGASLELDSAEAVLTRSGASLFLADCERLRERL